MSDAQALASTGPKGIGHAELKAALIRHGGVYALAAKHLGISRQAVHERVKRSPELASFVSELEEHILDAAEWVIYDAILNKKDAAMARWYLERKGRSRGYGRSGYPPERVEAPKQVTVEVVYVTR